MTIIHDRQFEPIPIPDADVSILNGVDMSHHDDQILHALINQTDWRQESVRVFGKVHPQPRLIAWYGDPGKDYTYSGLTLPPLPWTGLLCEIKQRVEACTKASFNSVLLNLYRDHHDSMGFHSDDERELGLEPTIASVSFGASRMFRLKHKKNPNIPRVKIPLESGSVLLMKGVTQNFWKHGIPKQSKPCGPRVNLTFRTIIDR